MENFFDLNGKIIILYGAASIGSLAIGYFEDNGYKVWGFIDKRGHEIGTFLGKKVYELGDEEINSLEKKECVVFVSVKNVFEHTQIANNLISAGFSNIIYRPISVINGHGTEKQVKINEIYNLIETGNVKDCIDIPKTEVVEQCNVKKSYIKRENEDGTIVAMISVNSLYTDNKMSTTPWFDIPIFSLLPHIDLFKAIGGSTDAKYMRYMDFCMASANNSKTIVVTDAWKENVFKNRSNVYEHMNKSYELEPDFFTRNAPKVIWNDKRCIFNLNSGKHRAAFFAAHSRKYIPVTVNKNEYKRYLNEKASDRVTKYLNENRIFKLKAPIEHPDFFDFETIGAEFYYNLLYKLFYAITEDIFDATGEVVFHTKKICFELNDDGFIERAFYKAGFQIDISDRYLDISLMEKLDNLFYCDLSNRIIERDKIKAGDYALLDFREGIEDISVIGGNYERISDIYCIVETGSEEENTVKSRYDTEIFFISFIEGKSTEVLKVKRRK